MNFKITLHSEDESFTRQQAISLKSWLHNSEIQNLKVESVRRTLQKDEAAGLTLDGVLTVALGGLIARYAEPVGKAIYNWIKSRKKLPSKMHNLKLTIVLENNETLTIAIHNLEISRDEIASFLMKSS